jgi:hypothetical protein
MNRHIRVLGTSPLGALLLVPVVSLMIGKALSLFLAHVGAR